MLRVKINIYQGDFNMFIGEEYSDNEQAVIKEVSGLLLTASREQLIESLFGVAYAFIDAAEPHLSDKDKWYKSLIMMRYSLEAVLGSLSHIPIIYPDWLTDN